MRGSVGLASVVLLASALCPAAAATNPVASAADKKGDVHFTSEMGLNDKQRRTVDLRRLFVTKTDEGPKVRLRLKRVVANGPFDQYFFVYFSADGFPFAYFKIRASKLSGPAGMEGADTPQGFAKCRVTARVANERKHLVVTMPNRCTPRGPVQIEALAYTTPLGEDGGTVVYSRDRMRVRGSVVVRD